MSKTRIICHIVFATKNRKKSINPLHKRDLYGFIYTICKKHKCWVHRINGMEEHVHILLDLNPSISLAELVKSIKWSSHKWMKGNPNFKDFQNWGEGYFAVSVSPADIESVKQYIICQEGHHSGTGFGDEIERIIRMYDMEWYPDDWD